VTNFKSQNEPARRSTGEENQEKIQKNYWLASRAAIFRGVVSDGLALS
jgi:hypothetical protein